MSFASEKELEAPTHVRALSLFPETQYFDYSFPQPQYLGAKYIHRNWIAQFFPETAKTALDAFGGSQSISFLMKQHGLQTITNDFLRCNHEIGLALIENKGETLSQEDVVTLFSENPESSYYNLFEHLYSNLFFSKDECKMLDAFRGNAERLGNSYKKAIAIAVMNRSMTRKVTMGHFAHTQALVYASSPERVKRNSSLIRPIQEIFMSLLAQYNAAVFDNGLMNESFNCDAIELLSDLSNIDLAYFDPPYCDSHADYQGFYHLLETFSMYWKDKQFVNSTKRYDPKRASGFDKKMTIVKSFEALFESSKKIPHWILSYNDRSYPDIKTMVDLVSKYRNVSVMQKKYDFGRGGKGSVAGSSEILIIGKP